MILPSTIRAMTAKGQNAYRVSYPAWTMKAGALSKTPFLSPEKDMQFPATAEHFAKQPAADKRCTEWNFMHAQLGAPAAVVTPVPASSLNPFFCL